jgi:hypothetical protein
MYIRIFADGPRAVGASTLEFHPQWWVTYMVHDMTWRVDLLHNLRYRTEGCYNA